MGDDGPATSFLREDGAPDWDAITFDVCCSRCGYNLRTLSRGLCPECGLAFEWREVLDRAAHASDFLFEHNWRTRPIYSLALTIWRSFRPRTFWSRVSIHEHVKPGPLIVFPLLAVIAFPIVFHGTAFLAAAVYEMVIGPIVPSWQSPRIGGVTLYTPVTDAFFELQEIAMVPLNLPPDYLRLFPSLLYYFSAFTLVICGLRQTLGKCKVRTMQVVRVSAYSVIPISVAGALVTLLILFLTFIDYASNKDHEIALACMMFSSLVAVPTIYLRAGLRHYLKLPRSGILAFSASLIALLLVYTTIVVYQLSRMN
jgi:hypothetical protein